MPPEPINLLQAVPDAAAQEQFVPLLHQDGLLLEQIVSHGKASPEGFWYDQSKPEWVALLRGTAQTLYLACSTASSCAAAAAGKPAALFRSNSRRELVGYGKL